MVTWPAMFISIRSFTPLHPLSPLPSTPCPFPPRHTDPLLPEPFSIHSSWVVLNRGPSTAVRFACCIYINLRFVVRERGKTVEDALRRSLTDASRLQLTQLSALKVNAKTAQEYWIKLKTQPGYQLRVPEQFSAITLVSSNHITWWISVIGSLTSNTESPYPHRTIHILQASSDVNSD